MGGVVVEDQTGALREIELIGQREREERRGNRGLREPAERTERRHPVAGLDRRARRRAAHDAGNL